MPNSTRMKWPYPAENQDPWYDPFEDMIGAIDSSASAAREDRNVFMGGGGTVSFNSTTGEVAWNDDLEIYSPEVGFLMTIPAGSVSLQDGELFYVDLVRSPTTNIVLAASVSSQVPQSDTAYVIGLRRDQDIYFRHGAKLSNGEAFNIFQGGGGSGTVGDTYERAATFSLTDGTSANQEATLGRTAYGGSIIGLSLEITEAVIGGTVVVTVKRNGFSTLTATLDVSNPTSIQTTASVGTWVTTPNDAITVEVDPTSYDNASGDPGGLTVNVTLTTGLTLGPTEIPDASNIVKGITKLSVAAVLANDPIAVGDNDDRVQGFTRTGTEVLLQTASDTVRTGPIHMDQNVSLTNYLEGSSGSDAALSAAGRGRLRYNELTNQWEISENGGAYQPLGQGSGWQVTGSEVELITSTNTVRVGTGTEAAAVPTKLHVIDDTDAGFTVKNGTVGGVEVELYANGTTDAQLGTNSNHPLTLYTNLQEQWHLSTSGNLTADRNGQSVETSILDFSVEPGGSGTNQNYLAGGAGSSAAVSSASTGRIRYNETTNKWQYSENGAAYQDFSKTASSYVETATFGLNEGPSVQEATLGRVTYSGYLIGVSVHAEDATTGGTVTVTVKVDGVVKLTATLDTFDTEQAYSTTSIGTYGISQGNEITVEVTANGSYSNLAGGPTGLVVNVTMTDTVGATGNPNFALLDAAQLYSASQTVSPTLLSITAGSVDIDANTSNNFELVLDQNVTINAPTNVDPGQVINIAIRQDGTGGWTVAWNSAFKFPGGAPTVTATANAEDLVSGYARSPSILLCSIAQDHT